MKTIICTICHEEKTLDQFSPNEHRCKPCNSRRAIEYRKKHPEAHRRSALAYYYRHREKLKRKNREAAKNRRIRNGRLIWDHLKEHPCIDCGETDPIVLQFDHVKEKKEFSIGMQRGNVSEERLKIEIAKCVVRCANCHARKTHKERGYLEFYD
jgi:hypothetical protein